MCFAYTGVEEAKWKAKRQKAEQHGGTTEQRSKVDGVRHAAGDRQRQLRRGAPGQEARGEEKGEAGHLYTRVRDPKPPTALSALYHPLPLTQYVMKNIKLSSGSVKERLAAEQEVGGACIFKYGPHA